MACCAEIPVWLPEAIGTLLLGPWHVVCSLSRRRVTLVLRCLGFPVPPTSRLCVAVQQKHTFEGDMDARGVFLQARALGFLIPLSLELFTLRCLSCSLLSLVNPKHSDVEIQRSSWQGPLRICGWWQSRGPCWMMKRVLFSFFLKLTGRPQPYGGD